MKWLAALAATAGACGFAPTAKSTSSDAGSGSSADASTDAPAACTIVAGGSPVAVSTIGGNSGSAEPALACAAAELPIGIQLDMSSSPISNHGGEVVAVATHLRCGKIARSGSGAMTTTPAELVTQLGNQGGGNCNPYFPTVATPEVDCPAGAVIVGLDGNLPLDTLFNSLTITCASLSGAVLTTSTVVLPVDTTHASNNVQHAPCGIGMALVQLGLRGACGQDELLPQCAVLACE